MGGLAVHLGAVSTPVARVLPQSQLLRARLWSLCGQIPKIPLDWVSSKTLWEDLTLN